MDTLKGLADVVQQLLYETLGLLLPGLIAVVAIAVVSDMRLAGEILRFGEHHFVLSIASMYVAGYVLQGLSRPLVQLGEIAFGLLPRLVLRVVGIRVRAWLARGEHYLSGRHAHTADEKQTADVDIELLVRSIWEKKLGLRRDQHLRSEHVRDLSFSALLSNRGQLDRFRASASLCRGVAAVVVVLIGLLLVQLAVGVRLPSWPLAGVIQMLVITFYALMERADMYDRLWRNIVPTQFLAATAPLSNSLSNVNDLAASKGDSETPQLTPSTVSPSRSTNA